MSKLHDNPFRPDYDAGAPEPTPAAPTQPKHLVRRGMRPDGTFPLADDDEATIQTPSDYVSTYCRKRGYVGCEEVLIAELAAAQAEIARTVMADQVSNDLAATIRHNKLGDMV